MENSNIQEILSNSKRCLEIYLGERPNEDCLKCPYKHLGADCVFALIEDQNNLLKKYTRFTATEEDGE